MLPSLCTRLSQLVKNKHTKDRARQTMACLPNPTRCYGLGWIRGLKKWRRRLSLTLFPYRSISTLIISSFPGTGSTIRGYKQRGTLTLRATVIDRISFCPAARYTHQANFWNKNKLSCDSLGLSERVCSCSRYHPTG